MSCTARLRFYFCGFDAQRCCRFPGLAAGGVADCLRLRVERRIETDDRAHDLVMACLVEVADCFQERLGGRAPNTVNLIADVIRRRMIVHRSRLPDWHMKLSGWGYYLATKVTALCQGS